MGLELQTAPFKSFISDSCWRWSGTGLALVWRWSGPGLPAMWVMIPLLPSGSCEHVWSPGLSSALALPGGTQLLRETLELGSLLKITASKRSK